MALQRDVEQRVGSLVFVDEASPTRRIDVRISRADATWRATIGMRDAEARPIGTRTIAVQSDDCRTLDDAIVVVMSTMIGVAEPRPPPPPAAERPAPESPKPPPETAPPAPVDLEGAKHQETREPLGAWVALDARTQLGLLPRLSPGASLTLALVLERWTLFASGMFWPELSHALGRGAYAEFEVMAGEAGACLRALGSGLSSLEFCVAAQAGAILVATYGLATGARRTDPVASVSTGPHLQMALIRGLGLGLDIAIEAVAPVIRSRFYFLEADETPSYYHTVSLGIAARIGLYWRFSS